MVKDTSMSNMTWKNGMHGLENSSFRSSPTDWRSSWLERNTVHTQSSFSVPFGAPFVSAPSHVKSGARSGSVTRRVGCDPASVRPPDGKSVNGAVVCGGCPGRSCGEGIVRLILLALAWFLLKVLFYVLCSSWLDPLLENIVIFPGTGSLSCIGISTTQGI